MLSLVGFIIVLVSVIMGYVLHHGNLLVLYQPTELLIIGGAGGGALVASSSPYLLKHIVHEIIGVFTGSGVSKEKYLQLLKCYYDIFKQAASNPLSIEAHVEKPEASDIFKKYPLLLKDHHLMVFICNTLLVKVSSSISPYDLEELMDQDIQTMHDEEKAIPATISRMADAFPGLGIVAAVLGIVITMGKLSEGKSAIGQSVAAALVGTFLGILLCYGFFQPLAARVEALIEQKGKIFFIAKAGLVSFAKGANPAICVEYTRRCIPLEHRPSFQEVEKATKGGGK